MVFKSFSRKRPIRRAAAPRATPAPRLGSSSPRTNPSAGASSDDVNPESNNPTAHDLFGLWNNLPPIVAEIGRIQTRCEN
jgi:hypothetical protein